MNEIVPIKLYEYLAMNEMVISTLLYGIYREFGLSNGVVYIKSPMQSVEKALKLNIHIGSQGRDFILEKCD